MGDDSFSAAGAGDTQAPVNRTVVTPVSHFRREAFPIRFTGDHAVLGIVTIAALIGLVLFFTFTRAGIGIRGAAENDDRASLLGINTGSLSTLVWAMAAGLSGLAAVLQIPISGFTPASAAGSVGSGLLLVALAAAVIGGMEDLAVTVVAGISLAVFQQVVFYRYRRTALVDAALLLVILAAFLLQRRRLARTDESGSSTWAAADEVRPVPAELAGLPVVQRAGRRLVWVGLALTAGYPFVMSPSQTNIGSLFLLYGIVVVSLVILTGWGGQVSLGQFAFVGVGALVGGAIIDKTSLPFPVALLAGSLAGAVLAVLLGLTALRVRGLYLAVTTLAFAVAFQTVGLNRDLFGSLMPRTVSRPVILVKTEDERVFYFVCLAALAFAWWAALGLRRSRTGRVLIAARDNERGAQAFGVNLVRTRLATFALSGFLAAFAGVLYAVHQHSVTPSAFGPDQSIQIFLTAIIGGLGSVQGALLGALYFAIVGIVIPGTVGKLLASSGGVLLVLLFFPGGLGALAYQARDAVLRRIAIRRRIYVPSLLADRFRSDGALDRVPLAERVEAGEDVPRRYRLTSRIGRAGASQSGRRWRYE
jgi:branched-chain amino acid transport system permease protein